jgi:metallophosphoesterase (TIGR00282 family)
VPNGTLGFLSSKLEKGCKDNYSVAMSIRFLFLGEIVGNGGLLALKEGLKPLCAKEEIDFVIANGEGVTGGFGIGKTHALRLLKMGVDLITTGEKTYFKKDMVTHIKSNSKILRPANYPKGTPGRGYAIYEIKGHKVGFITLLGNADFPRTHLSNPFLMATPLVEKIKEETPLIFVQFHASTTAEKQAMAHHLAGKVSGVIGTHSKVLTADATILNGGTAMITDNGRCGSSESVGGFSPEVEIERFITQIPSRSEGSLALLQLQGVIVDVDEGGKASAISLVREDVTPLERAI